MAHIRQPRPESGLGFQVKDLEIFSVVPSALGSGEEEGTTCKPLEPLELY